MNVIIETERLILREMEMSDLDFMAGLFSDLKVMRFYPKLYSRREVQGIVERQIFRYRLNGRGLWIAEDKKLKQPVGTMGLLMQVVDFKAEPEIGYLLHPDFWKHGYATEAGIATRDYAFNTLNFPYVISLIRPINLPSQNVARRLGMEISRRTICFDQDIYVFRVDRAQH